MWCRLNFQIGSVEWIPRFLWSFFSLTCAGEVKFGYVHVVALVLKIRSTAIPFQFGRPKSCT